MDWQEPAPASAAVDGAGLSESAHPARAPNGTRTMAASRISRCLMTEGYSSFRRGKMKNPSPRPLFTFEGAEGIMSGSHSRKTGSES